MYVGPFHVERTVRITDNGHGRKVAYAVARTGDGELCWTDDVTFAYRLVDLLNEEVHQTDVNR